MTTEQFQDLVRARGEELYRDMPWRNEVGAYEVLVSEMMLQQTQVDRVIPKYLAFLERFPTVERLAEASLAEVLPLWSGLGYNRRAKYLQQAAQQIVRDYGGRVPSERAALESLPGIGPNTAGAILAYAYNSPEVFIETNVRTVYFHHFFAEQDKVSDAELREIVHETLPRESVRNWYWALMDYGSWLKKQGQGSIRQSATYRRQAPLKGSLRETRGVILRVLSEIGAIHRDELALRVNMDDRFSRALDDLLREDMIWIEDGWVSLPLRGIIET